MAQVETDVEAAQEEIEYLPGYRDFAEFIASDHSLSVYRKFAVLGARNLLHLQAELQLLELQLHNLDLADQETIASSAAQDPTETEIAARSWDDLKMQANKGDEKQIGRLRIIYKIRKLMKEYGKHDRNCPKQQINMNNRGGLAPAKPSSPTRETSLWPLSRIPRLVPTRPSSAMGKRLPPPRQRRRYDRSWKPSRAGQNVGTHAPLFRLSTSAAAKHAKVMGADVLLPG